MDDKTTELEKIKQAIGALVDSSTGEPLYNNFKELTINEEKDVVTMEINIGALDPQNDTTLKRQIAKIIKIDMGYNGVKIKFIERRKSLKVAGPNTKFIMVSGGKGGVGKSMVTANLANALSNKGLKIGIIDADIYGASIPTMIAMHDASVSVGEGNKINPFKSGTIEVISTDFFSEYEKPVVWQGNTLFTMINNFLYQVNWSKDLDYILIDMPTGTGDVLLTFGKELKDAQVLLVTNDDILSANMALKTAKAHNDVGQNIFGFVTNKADGSKFSEKFLNSKLNIPQLASIPFEEPKNSAYLYDENDKNYRIFNDLAIIISSVIM